MNFAVSCFTLRNKDGVSATQKGKFLMSSVVPLNVLILIYF